LDAAEAAQRQVERVLLIVQPVARLRARRRKAGRERVLIAKQLLECGRYRAVEDKRRSLNEHPLRVAGKAADALVVLTVDIRSRPLVQRQRCPAVRRAGLADHTARWHRVDNPRGRNQTIVFSGQQAIELE